MDPTPREPSVPDDGPRAGRPLGIVYVLVAILLLLTGLTIAGWAKQRDEIGRAAHDAVTTLNAIGEVTMQIQAAEADVLRALTTDDEAMRLLFVGQAERTGDLVAVALRQLASRPWDMAERRTLEIFRETWKAYAARTRVVLEALRAEDLEAARTTLDDARALRSSLRARVLELQMLGRTRADVHVQDAIRISRSATVELAMLFLVVSAFAGSTVVAVRRLRRSERRTGEILETASDAILAIGEDGTVVDRNPAAAAMFGLPASRGTARPSLDEILPEVDLREVEAGGASREVMARRRDGTEFAAEIGISGEPRTRRTVVVRDVSARKRAEQRLRDVQRELVRASREAGRADVATTVLHDVGNVLNSAGVSARVLADGIERSRMPDVAEVARLVAAHRDDVESFFREHTKGRLLPEYFAKIGPALEREHQALALEVRTLVRHLEHVTQLIDRERRHTRRVTTSEAVEPRDLVAEAVELEGRETVDGVRVEVAVEDLPPVVVDRHKVLQVLVNLLRNARQAIAAKADGTGRVVVTARRTDGDRFEVAIRDDGIGIAAGELTHIFRRARTTKSSGLGFGLHGSANAAREMGGP